MDMAPVPEPEPAFPADSFDGAIDDTYKNETMGADPGEAYEPEAEPVTEGETVGGLHVTYVDGMCAEATELFADREWEIEPSGDEANEFWVLFHYLIDWEKALPTSLRHYREWSRTSAEACGHASLQCRFDNALWG